MIDPNEQPSPTQKDFLRQEGLRIDSTRTARIPPDPSPLEEKLIGLGFRIVQPGEPETVVSKPGDPAISVKMLASAWIRFLRGNRERFWWTVTGGFAFGAWFGWFWCKVFQ